jgi:hypothetical protein
MEASTRISTIGWIIGVDDSKPGKNRQSWNGCSSDIGSNQQVIHFFIIRRCNKASAAAAVIGVIGVLIDAADAVVIIVVVDVVVVDEIKIVVIQRRFGRHEDIEIVMDVIGGCLGQFVVAIVPEHSVRRRWRFAQRIAVCR